MYIDILIKMLAGAIGVFIIFRLMGKKAASELTPFDLIYVLVLSGLLKGAIYDPLVTVWDQLFAIAAWGIMVYLVEMILEKTEYTTKVIQGEPSVLINEGKVDKEELKRNHIDLEQLRALLRQHGCYTLKDAYYAILEINGNMTVIKKSEEEAPSILLIDEGRIDYDILKAMNKDEEWLQNELEKAGYSDVKDIFYGEWLPEGELYVHPVTALTTQDEKLDG